MSMLPPIRELLPKDMPDGLKHIPRPPRKLYVRGHTELTSGSSGKKILTVVGPRRHTSYGRDVTRLLISALRSLPVIIVSGLAYGIDSIAHEAALESGLPTIAFPASGLAEDAIYPRRHFHLAERIVAHGGMLISEYGRD